MTKRFVSIALSLALVFTTILIFVPQELEAQYSQREFEYCGWLVYRGRTLGPSAQMEEITVGWLCVGFSIMDYIIAMTYYGGEMDRCFGNPVEPTPPGMVYPVQACWKNMRYAGWW